MDMTYEDRLYEAATGHGSWEDAQEAERLAAAADYKPGFIRRALSGHTAENNVLTAIVVVVAILTFVTALAMTYLPTIVEWLEAA